MSILECKLNHLPFNRGVQIGRVAQEWSLRAHTLPNVSKSDAGHLKNKVASEQSLKRKCKKDNDYDGVRHKKSRLGKYVSECRLSALVHGKKAGKVWLGSFSTTKEAARAYDVGRMFCSKKAKGFNFRESEDILSVLKHVILNLPLPARKKAIQDVASEYGKTGCIDGCTLKYCSQDNKPIRWNSEVGR